ncbi:MFS transporter [Kribbella sp. VKM Ac-2571]|uniref:MFS transporter n=1 Tax=Kribbella sp. VKM Ac-2571 TaxID=2512222 RepID=UPI001414D278|nr:MFS transporter [Kribbella sp. VKM Ac-2571]
MARPLCLQSALYAVGSGVFLSGNAVFFTQVVGLSAAQVGLGISIAGILGFVVSVPLGSAVDHVGPRRAWLLAALVEGSIYLAYPWARGFAAFLGIVVALALAESAGNSGRGAYTLDILASSERVRVLAYTRSALNLGFTLGGLLGGFALAAGSRTVITAIPLVAGMLMLLNSLLISRLPKTNHKRRGERVSRFSALRDRPFLAVSLLNGILGSHHALLMVVFPLWLVERTDAPNAVVAWLFGLNTLLAVSLQVWAARGAETVRGAVRASRLAAVALTVWCLAMLASSAASRWTTIALLFVGYVAITFGELFQSAGAWGLASELSPADQRAQYQGAFRLGHQLQLMLAPAAFTALTVTWSPIGWLVIAAVVALAAATLGPAASGTTGARRRSTAAAGRST